MLGSWSFKINLRRNSLNFVIAFYLFANLIFNSFFAFDPLVLKAKANIYYLKVYQGLFMINGIYLKFWNLISQSHDLKNIYSKYSTR